MSAHPHHADAPHATGPVGLTEVVPGSPGWRGAVAWEESEGRHRAWRLLPDRAERAHSPELIRHATMAAGVHAAVRTDADEARLDVTYDHDLPARLDVRVDGELAQRVEVTAGEVTVRHPLPAGTHDVEVWLPQIGQCWVGPLALDGATTTAPLPAASTRWVTYGSSITHCSSAFGPSETWPALVARSLGWDLTCLGFGGQCHLDPIAWRTIAAQPVDVVSMCLGINVHGGASYSARTFGAHVSEFVEQVRLAHPRATLVVMSPIASPDREHAPSASGLTLSEIRDTVHAAVAVLQRDDPDLHLVDGLDVLGPDDVHLLHDRLHPDGDGYHLMGERLAARLGAAHRG